MKSKDANNVNVSSSSQPICANCTPSQNNTGNAYIPISRAKCDMEYDEVTKCMIKFNGNVNDCKLSWQMFRNCFYGNSVGATDSGSTCAGR